MAWYDKYNFNAYEKDLADSIQWEKAPAHIAIIMDGNGRWAAQRDLPRIEGHRQGVDTVRDIVKACRHLEVEVLTIYAFSTENWKRPKWEVKFLLELPYKYLQEDLQSLLDNNIKLRISGEAEALPAKAREAISNALDRTANNNGMIFNMAINYGGRPDIVQAARRIAFEAREGQIKLEDIEEKFFANYLQTAGLPDPELVIRTSGELRVSNFLLWQIAYAELYFTPVYWPDFKRMHLLEAIYDYQTRRRRYGGLEEE